MRYLIEIIVNLFLPKWRSQKEPEARHFYRRTLTQHYKSKKEKVKTMWIGAGITMLAIPLPQFIIPAIFFTSFLSFCILDESVL